MLITVLTLVISITSTKISEIDSNNSRGNLLMHFLI